MQVEAQIKWDHTNLDEGKSRPTGHGSGFLRGGACPGDD